MQFSKRFSDEQMLDRTDRREDASFWMDESPLGIVCTAHYRATEAGVKILEKGGNAVDAAVAASLALGVVEPAASGLGGMAIMLIHQVEEQRTLLLEGACRAPLEASPEEARRSRDQLGYSSVAVPTNPAVIAHALARYGTLDIADVAEPAIELAEVGHRVTPLFHNVTKQYLKQIRRGNAGKLLLDGDNNPPEVGTVRRNLPLAGTLRRLAEHGVEEFYQGWIGEKILEDMADNSGFLSDQDFKTIPWPSESEPLRGSFHTYQVHTTPPPGGGFVTLEMLNVFEAWEDDSFDPDSPSGAVLLAMIIGQARRDRRHLRLRLTTEWARAKPTILSKTYASQLAAVMRSQLNDEGETTHLNAIDRHGNVVALTQSIERSFGAKVATPELGFLYNGFMKGFKVVNKLHPHYLKAGAVARSNSSPTILLSDDGRKIAIGSTGSERMASGIFQVLVRLLSQSPFEAVKAPRLHSTPEGQVFYERGRVDAAVRQALKFHGYMTVPYPEPWAFSAGGLHLAGDDGKLKWGVAEPRRDGLAAAPMS